MRKNRETYLADFYFILEDFFSHFFGRLIICVSNKTLQVSLQKLQKILNKTPQGEFWTALSYLLAKQHWVL